MKKTIIGIVCILLAALAPVSQAGNYSYFIGASNHYGHYGYGRIHSDYWRYAGYVIGGLALASVINHYTHRHHDYHYKNYNKRYYRNDSYRRHSHRYPYRDYYSGKKRYKNNARYSRYTRSNSRYFMDAYRNCFKIKHRYDGRLIRIEVPEKYCY